MTEFQNERPKVSIWSITYNHKPFIRDCLESIVNQNTNFDFELIIGDDASTDGTTEILIEYQKKYPNIVKPIIHKKNVGVFENSIIHVFPKLKGEYIAICEGDDFWMDLDKLQKQVDFMDQNLSYSSCFHRCSIINQANEVIKADKWKEYADRSALDMILGNRHLITSTVLFRNQIEFPKQTKNLLNIDTILWHLLGFLGPAKFLSDIKPSAYRVHDGGVWSLKDKNYQIRSTLLTNSFMAQNIKDRKPNLNLKPLYLNMAKNLNAYMLNLLVSRRTRDYLSAWKLAWKFDVINFPTLIRIHFNSILNQILNKLNWKN